METKSNRVVRLPLVIITLFCVFMISGQSNLLAQKLPEITAEAYKRIDKPARDEVSGIVKSPKYKNVYWVHGDSGTPDRIYAINRNGDIVSNKKKYKGAKVKGAKNIDWEDMALGENGTLILADIGNNCECRDNLKIFILEEPEPDANEVNVLFEYAVKYPARKDILGKILNQGYNAEAVFQKDGVIFILTKESGITNLFKLENPSEEKVNKLEFVESLKVEELVTAADISPDGKHLAILMYDRVWIIDISKNSFLAGKKKGLLIKKTKQIESITFDDEFLIIVEEEGELYEIPVSALQEIND